jgi:hydroxyethylthiazole kinase
MQSMEQLAEHAGHLLTQFRNVETPLHCIAGSVDESFTCRILDAIGCTATMTHDPREVADFVANSGALLVQLGSTNDMRESGIATAIAEAKRHRKPWVLDTIFAGRSQFRSELVKSQLTHKPAIVRSSSEDIAALMLKKTATYVDFAARHQTVSVCSGRLNRVSDGVRSMDIPAGTTHFRNARNLANARSAMCAAMMTVERDAYVAAVSALAIVETAALVATKASEGPGSFSIFFLDALSFVTAEDIAKCMTGQS